MPYLSGGETTRRSGRNRPPIAGVVTDLDGTLLRSDGTLSGDTRVAVEACRRRGIPFVVATARTPRAVRKVDGYQLLGLMTCANGAVVWDASSDELVSASCFVAADLLGALDRLRAAVSGVAVALLSPEVMYLDHLSAALRSNGSSGAIRVADFGDPLRDDKIILACVRHAELGAEALIDSVAQSFEQIGIASFAGRSTVEVVAVGRNKATATERALHEFRLRLDEVLAFGDMPNDLPLFDAACWSCAVSNAHPLVLAAADEVVPSNDDDGVASTIRAVFAL